MKRKISISVLALFVLISTLLSSISFAATIGQSLTAPEDGWKRYDDRDLSIFFSAPNPHLQTYSGSYKNTLTYPSSSSDNTTDYIKFKFTGTKLIIGTLYHGQHSGVNVIVDGVDLGNFKTKNTNTLYQRVAFMKTDFTPGEHIVTLKATDKTVYNATFSLFALDYVDIDSNGQLLPYNSITNLTATAGSAQIDLSWSAEVDTNSYTVKRGTTPGGPYDVVADNLTNTSYNDIDVTYGTTYYYVVVGKNNEGTSPASNEASATPTATTLNAPTNLIATGDNETQSNKLHWDSVTEATYYQVSRSTVAGGPYSIIASDVTGTTFEDVDIVQGTTYYYIVVAVNQGVVSEQSNEASAELEVSDYGRALLTIYISGGQIKEYDLSKVELDAFITWYDAKDAGTGPAKYAFTKTWNKGPFKSRTEYVIFDKILTFDVDEYDPIQQ